MRNATNQAEPRRRMQKSIRGVDLKTSKLDEMKNLLKAGNLCVLATCAEGSPHCSLMAYITDGAVTTVYMVTFKQTQKYRNLLQNPQASLLVDTRHQQPPPTRAEIQALTVSGTFQPIAEKDTKQRILEQLAERHPQLRELIANNDAEPFAIKIHSFLLLDGALDAEFIEI
jgi:nitroimidazol reductase NimA-like FMN-containing flavoprotein (pyridoxamine 5'-phosphate oxidase superfamily)